MKRFCFTIVLMMFTLMMFAQATKMQYVMFRVTPKDAKVVLNGETLDVYDGIASKRMPFGLYEYEVSAPNYTTVTDNVSVFDPDNKHIVEVNLKSESCKITFCVEDDAEIWINDKNYGKGSCTVDLPYGHYVVECRKAGHKPSRREINVSSYSVGAEYTLNPPTPAYGSLDINSIPGDAGIWLDGKKIGTTPMFINECLIGEHQIVIKKAKYKTGSQKITIEEGETSNVFIKLEEGVDDEIHDGVEQMPSFPGGTGALMSWLSNNIHYPAVAEENGIQGRVICSFVIERDGSLTDVRVAKGVDPSLDKEAIRVVKSMPKWFPGKINGEPVRVKFTLPITFGLR